MEHYENKLTKDLEENTSVEQIQNDFTQANYDAQTTKDLLAYSSWLNQYAVQLIKNKLGWITVDALKRLSSQLQSHQEAAYQKELVDTYEHLAMIYAHMGDAQGSETYYQKAIRQSEKTYGNEHLKTAEMYYAYARYFVNKNYAILAEPFLLKALRIYIKNDKEEHPVVLDIYDDLADVYEVSDQFEQAERYLKKGLEVCKKLYGEDSLDSATLYNHLGFLFVGIDRHKAAKFYKKEWEIYKKVYGENHPETLRAYQDFLKMQRL